MCNEVARRIALDQLRADWSQTKIPLLFPEGLPNLAPLASVRITDPTLILRAAREGQGAEAVVRRWSWPGPGGKPVYNYRSEGREFRNSAGQGRCLIVADAFYEFTAPADAKAKRKDKWAFTVTGADWFAIAGLWRGHDAVGEAFTMLTTDAGPDLAGYHSRQIVILDRADWGRWLDGSAPAADLCRPLPAGTLSVAPVARDAA